MSRVAAVALLLTVSCTVPSINELEGSRPSSCTTEHPCPVHVTLSYSTFRPGCLTLTMTDKADPSRSDTQQVEVGQERSATREIWLKARASWGQDLSLTARAFEQSCTGPQVALAATDVHLVESSAQLVSLDLRADDLDGDGYVRKDQGGSDCDDNDASVNPAASEVCNGKDDNCSGDESDVPGSLTYYADVDKDGYGDPASQQKSCVQPANTVTNGRDCNDADRTVHPDQPETLCDGRNEDCSGGADDSFSVGTSCTTPLRCAGAFVCKADRSASECVSSDTPVQWFVDLDGDGLAGTSAGQFCTAPMPGAAQTQDDCDDNSRFISANSAERCDRLDNNCNGQTDEPVACSAVAWHVIPGTPTTDWSTVAAYAEGKAWVAGLGGALASIDAHVVTSYTNCPGDWTTSWASPLDGRVFLGSTDGKLATLAVGQTTTNCQVTDPLPSTRSAFSGLVGFTNGGTATLFAVRSDGRIFQWTWSQTASSVVEVAHVSANLRSIHGTSRTNLLAVGAQTSPSIVARAFRLDPSSNTWIQETLPAGLSGFLRQVRVVQDQLAYAVGDSNVLLVRANGSWQSGPPSPLALENLVGLNVYGNTSLYAIGSLKNVYRFNGADWSLDQDITWTPKATDGVGPHDMWVAGSQGAVMHWGP